MRPASRSLYRGDGVAACSDEGGPANDMHFILFYTLNPIDISSF